MALVRRSTRSRSYDKSPLTNEVFLQKKYVSLRILFFRWLILFSVLPLAVIAFLFSYEFKSAVQIEIFERLLIYTKQVQDLFGEYEGYTQTRLDTIRSDKNLMFDMKTENLVGLSKSLRGHLDENLPASYVFYNRDKRAILRVDAQLSDDYFLSPMGAAASDALKQKDQYVHAFFYELEDRSNLNLSVIRRLREKSPSWEGYLEKVIVVNEKTLQDIKNDFGFDIIFFGPKGRVYLSSVPDAKFTKEQLSQHFLKGNNHYFDVEVQGKSFGFVSTAVNWGDQKFLVAIGAAKTSLTKSVNRFRYILMTAFILLIFGIILFSYKFTNLIMQPVSNLVHAIKSSNEKGVPIEVTDSGRTEIGLLADNFNQMARQISTYQKDLENKITDLEAANKEVKQTQSQLIQSEKLAGLGQLVAGVAHELNNPIGFIYSNISHLREYSESLLEMVKELGKDNEKFPDLRDKYDFDFISKDLSKLIDSCEDGAKRTREIVVGLRNFSRASDTEEKRFSVTDCLDSTLDLLKSAIKKKNIQLEKTYDEFVPLLVGNPNQISQVMMNILTNAFFASPERGEVHVSVKHSESDQKIHVSIRDKGEGIAADHLDKIFDPFFTTKDVGIGTGLGLSISYGIVQSHGGDVRVESEVGKGTCFYLSFPVESQNDTVE